MAEEKVREELGFLDWVKKVNERATTIQLRINNRIDISEDDYFLLQVLHKVWWNGELPFFHIKSDVQPDNVTQNGLFDVVTVTEVPKFVGGIVVDNEAMNQNELKDE